MKKPVEVTIAASDEKEDGFQKFQLEEWMRTLEEADAIRQDKEKMAALKPFIEKKVKAIKSLADLRNIAQERIEAAGDDDDL